MTHLLARFYHRYGGDEARRLIAMLGGGWGEL